MSLAEGIKANIGLKILALFLATALWYTATRHKEAEESLAVPVVLENIPAHLALTGGPPPVIMIVIAGPANELTLQGTGGLKAVLDLKGVGPGTVSFDCQAAVRLRRGLRAVRVQPSRIELRLVEKE